MKKINHHKILKKHKLKPIEINSKKKEESESRGNKSEEKISLEEIAGSEKKFNSDFHETILEQSIDFPAPVIKEIEPEIDKEEKETLENTARRIETPFQTNNINTTNNSPNYATGLTSSTYAGIQTQQSSNQSYQSNSSSSPFLDKENLGRRTSQPVLGANDGSSTNDFQSMQDKYKDDRERDNTNLPFEERKRRHGVWT
jgi:hypothetical protein